MTSDSVTLAFTFTTNSKFGLGSRDTISENGLFDEGEIVRKGKVFIFADDRDWIFVGVGKASDLAPMTVFDRRLR